MKTPYTHLDGYMMRYWLFNPYPSKSSGKRPWWQFPISIRLHHILREDDDRALHDHPWNARTIILKGSYSEVRLRRIIYRMPSRFEARRFAEDPYEREPGDTARLNFGEYHRITSVTDGGVWTLFITGRYRGTWGFLVNGKKVNHGDYLGEPNQ